jgi:tetratricopeptide (TPR) repeat protein
MTDTYSIVTLLKHYGWRARDLERKPALARQLLQVALKIAQDKLPDQIDLHKQLRRDIAGLNNTLGQSEEAIDEFNDIGYDFNAGDIYLEQGQFEKAFEIYKRFHDVGRFKIHWRLWRCSFLLGRFSDVLNYIEDHSSESPQRIITQLEARALAVAAVNVYNDLASDFQSREFKGGFPNCVHILDSKIGNPDAVLALAKRWMTPSGLEKLTKRLIGKSKQKVPRVSEDFARDEFESILEKAQNGIWDIPEVEVVTATTILKSLATSNAKLDGKTVVDHMTKGFIHPIILEAHGDLLSQIVDLQLAEFQRAHGFDLISTYRDKILGSFGFYESNEVSKAIKSILLIAESEVREANGLPPRGAGWLTESEMVRLLTEKFVPHEIIRQYSPAWLQGLRFDAYIDDFQLAIEYQGEQHFKPIDLFGGEEGFAQTLARDQLKRSLADQNGIALEYITYEQDIGKETTRIAKEYFV